MRKFTWMLGFCVSITSSAYGSFLEINDDAEFEDGFYAGLSFGANWANADWDGLSSISLIDNATIASIPNQVFESWTPSGETHDSGKAIGKVTLGYQLVSARFYLGGEISGTFSDKRNFNLDDTRAFESTEYSPFFPPSMLTGISHTQTNVSLGNNEFDIDLKPGVLVLENFLIYGRVGVAFTKLKINNSGEWTEMVVENDVVLKPSDSSHNSKNVTGFRVGAGAEYLISEHLGVSLDYIFTDYGSIKTRADKASALPAPCDPTYTCFYNVYGVHAPEVEVTAHALMGGIVYHF